MVDQLVNQLRLTRLWNKLKPTKDLRKSTFTWSTEPKLQLKKTQFIWNAIISNIMTVWFQVWLVLRFTRLLLHLSHLWEVSIYELGSRNLSNFHIAIEYYFLSFWQNYWKIHEAFLALIQIRREIRYGSCAYYPSKKNYIFHTNY